MAYARMQSVAMTCHFATTCCSAWSIPSRPEAPCCWPNLAHGEKSSMRAAQPKPLSCPQCQGAGFTRKTTTVSHAYAGWTRGQCGQGRCPGMRPLPSLDPHKSRERIHQSPSGCRGSAVFWQPIWFKGSMPDSLKPGPPAAAPLQTWCPGGLRPYSIAPGSSRHASPPVACTPTIQARFPPCPWS